MTDSPDDVRPEATDPSEPEVHGSPELPSAEPQPPAAELSRLGWPSAPPPFTRASAAPPAAEPSPGEHDPAPGEATTTEPAAPVGEQDLEPVSAPAPGPSDLGAPVTPDPAPDAPTDQPTTAVREDPTPAAADHDADDQAAADEDAANGSAPRALLVPVLVALALVLAGLTGFLGWSAVRTSGPAPVDASRSQALAAAREAARLVFSYDYRRLDKDFAAGKAVTTGEFAKEYGRTTAKLVTDVAPRYKARVTADVSEASVVRATGDKVVCLVFVNQTSLSSLTPTPKITQSRLEMVLERSGDRWLVSSIDAL